ncbi:hypothetical protein GGX14DRAFT_568048 [Mycena pura]|uniref:Uncharacterized protein n=1 Tax=Mycena pura TaxID=153505 RepID=A0AAD6V9F5_9AGAR|nr:hypothetical protein GGX14DRAFT_568048 [Mycena pura]
METPFTTVADPQIKLVQDCTSTGCTYRMGPPRVHQGSNHPEHRGAIVQSCRNRACNRTVPLTQRYIMQDSDALLIRINARAKNLPISPADNVPLRLAPRVEVPDAVGGKMKCATPDCESQGAKTCIEYRCKKCCFAAVATVRDPCGYHRRAAIRDNPPPVPPATQSTPAARGTSARRGRNNGSTPAQAAPPFEPVNRGRALAQPIGPNWRAQTQENITHATAQNAKVLRLDLEEAEKKKVAFALYFTKGNPAVDMKEPVPTYPLFTLGLLPGLMTDLQLTESSRYQFWDYDARKWVFTVASTGISVDRARTTIIRFPATIRDVWTDDDCPGLDEYREPVALGVKRVFAASTPESSPLKKAAKLDLLNIDAASVSHTQQSNPSHPPPPLPPPSLPHASRSQPLPPSAPPMNVDQSERDQSERDQAERNYGSYPVSEWLEKWEKVRGLQDNDPAFPHEKDAFVQIFKRPYRRQTLQNYKVPFAAVSATLRKQYQDLGDVPNASLDHLFKAAGLKRGEKASTIISKN